MAAVVDIGFNAAAFHNGLSKVEARLSGFARASNKALSGVESLGRKAAGSLGLAGAVSLPSLARFGGDLVQAAGRMESYRAALTAVSKEAAPLESQLNRLRELAKAPGLSFDEAVKGSVRLQATGLSAQESERVLKEMANALRSVGGSAEQLDGVTLALSQIQAKGKVMAEEINQIAERMPQIRAVMKAAFGSADTEVLQKMGLSSRAFILGITNELAKGPRVMNGANSAIEQLIDNFNQLKAAAGEPLAQAVVPVIRRMTDEAVRLAPEAKEFVQALVGWVPVAARVGAGLASVYAALKVLQFASHIAGIRAKAQALVQSTGATQAETAALTANTAAQRGNAAAARAAAMARTAVTPAGPNRVSLREQRQPTAVFNAAATMAALQRSGQQAAARAGGGAARAFVGQFGAGLKSAGPGLGAVALSVYNASLVPASAEAGTQMAQALSGSLSTGLAMMGGKAGAAALAGTAVQTLMLRSARANLDEQEETGGRISRTQEASKESGELLRNGNLLKAREVLERELNLLVGERVTLEGAAALQADVSAQLVRRELSTLEARNVLLRQAAAAADAKTRAEIAAGRARAAAVAQQEAQGKVGLLDREVRDDALKTESPERQMDAIAQRLRERLQAAMSEVNVDQWWAGKGQFRDVELSLQGVGAVVEKLKAQGDFIGAEKLLKALKEAQPAAERLAQLQAQMRAAAAAQSEEAAAAKKAAAEKAAAISAASREAEIENEILRAKIAAGGQDSARVQQLEDRLAALRLARQIEDAGLAAGEAALQQAARHVGLQRQLSNLTERRQQAEGRQDALAELAILQAKATGQDKLASKLEREQAIRAKARQLQQQTGMSEQQALGLASRMQDLQDRAEKREGSYDAAGRRGDGRRQIRGYRSAQGAVRGFSGLDAFYRAQQVAASPMAEQAARNVQAEDKQQPKSIEQKLDELIAVTSKGLLEG